MSFNYKGSNNMRDVCTFLLIYFLMIIETVMEPQKKQRTVLLIDSTLFSDSSKRIVI